MGRPRLRTARQARGREVWPAPKGRGQRRAEERASSWLQCSGKHPQVRTRGHHAVGDRLAVGREAEVNTGPVARRRPEFGTKPRDGLPGSRRYVEREYNLGVGLVADAVEQLAVAREREARAARVW